MSTLTKAPALALVAVFLSAGPALVRSAPVDNVDAGATALVKGQSAEAVTSFTEALKDTSLSNDRRAAILNDRAVAYMRSGQPKLALDDFNQAAQLFPEYAAVYNNRGNLLLSLGLTKEAIKDFDRALVLAPGYASAFNNRAGAFMKTGQIGEAIQDFGKAVQLAPQNPAPLSGRGRAWLHLGKPYAASRDFTRAVNADARFASGYRNRAEAKIAIELYEEAIEDLSRAIAFDPNNAEIHLVRGEAYLASKNAAAAIKDFSRALELDPKLVAAYRLRGLAQGTIGTPEGFEAGLADLNVAIELEPRSAVAYAFRAILYRRSSQIDLGQKDLATAMKLDETRPEVWLAKGEIEEAAVQADLALAAYQKAHALKPGYRDAVEALQRLGALPPPPPPPVQPNQWSRYAPPPPPVTEPEIVELMIDKWRVVSRSGRPVALSQEYPRVSVPLETLGEGQPKLLSWELKRAPFLGIGVLRFAGGVMATKTGKEEIELAAIVDVDQGLVLAVVQTRFGARQANWTWEEGKLTVAGADGVTEELVLRVGRAPVLAQQGYGRPGYGQQPYYRQPGSTAVWSPFDGPWGGGSARQPSQRYTAPKKKAKSLFDLLFN